MEEITKEIESVLQIAEKIKQVENKPRFCISRCFENKANDSKLVTVKKGTDIQAGDSVLLIKIDNEFQSVYSLLKALNRVNAEQKVIEKLLETDNEYDYIDGERITTQEQHENWMKEHNKMKKVNLKDLDNNELFRNN